MLYWATVVVVLLGHLETVSESCLFIYQHAGSKYHSCADDTTPVSSAPSGSNEAIHLAETFDGGWFGAKAMAMADCYRMVLRWFGVGNWRTYSYPVKHVGSMCMCIYHTLSHAKKVFGGEFKRVIGDSRYMLYILYNI